MKIHMKKKIILAAVIFASIIQAVPMRTAAAEAETIKQVQDEVVTDQDSASAAFDKNMGSDKEIDTLTDTNRTIVSEEPETKAVEKSLVVTSPPFKDGTGYKEPDKIYINPEDGLSYELVDFKMIDVTLEKRSKQVENIIVYEDVEQADGVPKTCSVEVFDDVLWEYKKTSIPLSEISYEDYRWDDAFEFPIKFHEYDADYYAVDNILIPRDDTKPALKGYEKKLLDLIGVSEKFYVIEDFSWVSDAFADENGVICREARATGRKLVANCRAVYRGTAGLKATTAKAIEATYKTTVIEETGNTKYTVRSKGTYTRQGREKNWLERLLAFLWKFIKTPAGILSIALLFILLFFILILSILRRKRKKEEADKDSAKEDIHWRW